MPSFSSIDQKYVNLPVFRFCDSFNDDSDIVVSEADKQCNSTDVPSNSTDVPNPVPSEADKENSAIDVEAVSSS